MQTNDTCEMVLVEIEQFGNLTGKVKYFVNLCWIELLEIELLDLLTVCKQMTDV